jgi:hypothetical protein
MKKILPIIIAVVVVVGGAFYGGVLYAKKGVPGPGNFQGFANISSDGRQARFFQAGAAGEIKQGGARGGNVGGVAGEILSKDENSITVKLRDGGSKIVFFSDQTKVEKTVDGTVSDLEVGKTVMVTGSVNQDGSVTAGSVQLRPAMVQPKAQ